MVINYDRTTAFICPFCSSIVKKKINAFNFSGRNEINLNCPAAGCKEKCITIKKRPQKFKVDIECPICGDDHSVTYQSATFWNKELISYKCPTAGEDIFHCGTEKNVKTAIKKTVLEYCSPQDMDFTQNDLLKEMLELVKEIKDEDNIWCQCGCHDVLIKVVSDSISLVCKKCNRVRTIEPSDKNLIMLINAESIVIGD